jgi:hypothetical protein
MPKLGNGERFDGSSPEEPYFQMGDWVKTIEEVLATEPVTEDGATYFSLNEFIFVLLQNQRVLELHSIRGITLPLLTSALLYLHAYADDYGLTAKVSPELKALRHNLPADGNKK